MIEVLEQAAAEYPQVPAIIGDSGSLTYHELVDRLQPTTGRQVIALPNGPDWHVAFCDGRGRCGRAYQSAGQAFRARLRHE